MTKQRLKIRGMHCVGCAMTIDGALEDVAGVRSAATNYARQWVDVEYDEQLVPQGKLLDAIKQAGYEAYIEPSM